MKPVIPVSFRKWEQRVAANAVADAILRADARKQRAAVNKEAQSIKKAAPTVMAGRQPIRLADLKRAFADASACNVPSSGGFRCIRAKARGY